MRKPSKCDRKRLMVKLFDNYNSKNNGIPKFVILKITPQSRQNKDGVYNAVSGN